MTKRKDAGREKFSRDWEAAMSWWGSQPAITERQIRILANRRLSLRYAGSGQGISSSDTNYEVLDIWKKYIQEDPKVCVLTWVLDNLKAIEEAVSW